jgi:hypothetical protein
VAKSDGFEAGYSRAELDFLEHEKELATFSWPNPFDPGREPDAHEGYETAVYDFTQKGGAPVLTRRDLDAIAERLTGRDPAAEVAVLRQQLAEAHAVLDALAHCGDGPLHSEAARRLLAAHGVPGWSPKEESRA